MTYSIQDRTRARHSNQRERRPAWEAFRDDESKHQRCGYPGRDQEQLEEAATGLRGSVRPPPPPPPSNVAFRPLLFYRRSLTEYLCSYLIHSPFWAKSDSELQHAWAEMEEVQKAGLAKSIGVSNYLPQHLAAVLKTAKVVPACNQIEFHPYL